MFQAEEMLFRYHSSLLNELQVFQYNLAKEPFPQLIELGFLILASWHWAHWTVASDKVLLVHNPVLGRYVGGKKI